VPHNDADTVAIFDKFRPEALEYLLMVVEANEKAEQMKQLNEQDLYSDATNLYSVIERGEEYEADNV
jgi:hypothetical protein